MANRNLLAHDGTGLMSQSVKSTPAIVGGIAVFSLGLLAAKSIGSAALGGDPQWFNRSVATQLLWLMCNVTSMIGAGYFAAAIAPRAPRAHAVLMGALQSLFTLVAMLTTGDRTTSEWLWLSGIATTVPAAWAGARLRSGS